MTFLIRIEFHQNEIHSEFKFNIFLQNSSRKTMLTEWKKKFEFVFDFSDIFFQNQFDFVQSISTNADDLNFIITDSRFSLFIFHSWFFFSFRFWIEFNLNSCTINVSNHFADRKTKSDWIQARFSTRNKSK